MGYIVSIFGTTTTVVSFAAILGLCGAISATQVMYLDLWMPSGNSSIRGNVFQLLVRMELKQRLQIWVRAYHTLFTENITCILDSFMCTDFLCI